MTARTGEGPKVRAATPDDTVAVAAIFTHYVESSVVTFETVAPPAAAWVEKLAGIRGGGWPFLVAAEGPEVAGYAYVAPWNPRPGYRYTVESSVYVAPGRTGRAGGRGAHDRAACVGAARQPGLPRGRAAALRRLQARPLARHRAHGAVPSPAAWGQRTPDTASAVTRQPPHHG